MKNKVFYDTDETIIFLKFVFQNLHMHSKCETSMNVSKTFNMYIIVKLVKA